MENLNFLETAKKVSLTLSTPPLLTSAVADWTDVFFANYQHPPAEMETHTLPFHCLEIIHEVIDEDKECPHWRHIGERFSHRKIQQGDIFLCPANTEHKITWTKKVNFSLLLFQPCMIEQLAEELEISKPIEFIPQLHISNLAIQKVIEKLKLSLTTPSLNDSLMIQQTLIKLTKYLLENCTTLNQKIVKPNGKLSNNQIKIILDYIDTNIEKKIPIQDLADSIEPNYNYFHFCDLFTTTMGISPGQYILHQRLEKAQKLLSTTNYSIREISEICGFSNQNYFSEKFQQKHKLYPTQFREQCKHIKILI